MVENEYYCFTDMLDRGKIARTTLYNLIKDGKISYRKVGRTKMYSLKDVINNKPRKNANK